MSCLLQARKGKIKRYRVSCSHIYLIKTRIIIAPTQCSGSLRNLITRDLTMMMKFTISYTHNHQFKLCVCVCNTVIEKVVNSGYTVDVLVDYIVNSTVIINESTLHLYYTVRHRRFKLTAYEKQTNKCLHCKYYIMLSSSTSL